ncbi:hypothetical protein VDG1235_2199 [Verrucomicrobiia bacterium DG1235]|nr:hypothetical protein VDG1235_2199 [Verrucomicrobiae bacterium DG1235]
MLTTIDEVIEKLDQIVRQSIETSSPLGYFPALYKRVTIQVRDAIAAKAFDDNKRMEILDIVFANRYIEAYQSYQDGRPLTASWQAAFEAASKPGLLTLQHLLLGMNAHISLDLGIAAAESEKAKPLSLQNDFYAINRILESLIDDTQKRLTRIFGPLGIVDRLLGPIDERLSIYSITYARDKAWTQTLELSLADEPTSAALIAKRDKSVASFAKHLVHPPRLSIRILLPFVRLLERGNIATRIKILDTNP